MRFINGLNAGWVDISRRFSPRVLTDLLEKATDEVADFFEHLPLEAPALFAVSWAGERESEGWFDIGREFTELWHHQQQIRLAVGASSLADPRYLRAVIEIAVRGLPHAFRDTAAAPGQTVVIDVSGPAGGRWTLEHEAGAWRLRAGEPPIASARVHLTDEVLWKVLFNALTPGEIAAAIRIEGDHTLVGPLFAARSVIV